MNVKTRWGILATGWIAHQFAKGVASSKSCELVAIGSRDPQRAQEFATEFDIPNAYGDYESVIENSSVDAIYIATPHTNHLHWSAKAAMANKHVLCEKPIGINLAEAKEATDAAKTTGVTIMEGFMYRCHPQTAQVYNEILDGAIGRPISMNASFSFNVPYDPDSRLYNLNLGGGAILDVGGYVMSMARLVAGAGAKKAFAEPSAIQAYGSLHPESGADTYSSANLLFSCGLIAQISCGIHVNQQNSVRIYGDEGYIEIDEPWLICKDGGEWRFTLYKECEAEAKTICGKEERTLYGIEADHFHTLINGGSVFAPGMTVEDTLGNMSALDAWRQQIGLRYPSELE